MQAIYFIFKFNSYHPALMREYSHLSLFPKYYQKLNMEYISFHQILLYDELASIFSLNLDIFDYLIPFLNDYLLMNFLEMDFSFCQFYLLMKYIYSLVALLIAVLLFKYLNDLLFCLIC